MSKSQAAAPCDTLESLEIRAGVPHWTLPTWGQAQGWHPWHGGARCQLYPQNGVEFEVPSQYRMAQVTRVAELPVL